MPRVVFPAGLEIERLKHKVRLFRRWWFYPHKPYRPLFVLATYRSGSNLLLDYLNCLPGVRCLPELLCPALAVGPRHPFADAKSALKHIRLSLQALKTPIRGCKLMLEQMEGSRLTLDALDEAFPGARYIVLYRESLAEQFVSHKAAFKTKQWVLREGEERREACVAVEPTEFQRYCEGMRLAYGKVISQAWLTERTAVLSYEELTTEARNSVSEQVGPLLGVPVGKVKTLLRKQNRTPVAERVENYWEVAELMRDPRCRQQYLLPRRTMARRRSA